MRMTQQWKQGAGRVLAVLAIGLLALMPVGTVQARGGGGGGHGGSFGGGHSSFGGGSFGGGSFGGSRSSGSFGGGSRSFGGSFGRSGSFGGSRGSGLGSHVSSYATRTPVASRPFAYGGQGGSARYYGGWSDYSYGWAHPAWYMYTPFHPAFYYGPPVYYGGSYYPGQFDFTHLLITMVLVLAVIWLIVAIYKKARA